MSVTALEALLDGEVISYVAATCGRSTVHWVRESSTRLGKGRSGGALCGLIPWSGTWSTEPGSPRKECKACARKIARLATVAERDSGEPG